MERRAKMKKEDFPKKFRGELYCLGCDAPKKKEDTREYKCKKCQTWIWKWCPGCAKTGITGYRGITRYNRHKCTREKKKERGKKNEEEEENETGKKRKRYHQIDFPSEFQGEYYCGPCKSPLEKDEIYTKDYACKDCMNHSIRKWCTKCASYQTVLRFKNHKCVAVQLSKRRKTEKESEKGAKRKGLRPRNSGLSCKIESEEEEEEQVEAEQEQFNPERVPILPMEPVSPPIQNSDPVRTMELPFGLVLLPDQNYY